VLHAAVPDTIVAGLTSEINDGIGTEEERAFRVLARPPALTTVTDGCADVPAAAGHALGDAAVASLRLHHGEPARIARSRGLAVRAEERGRAGVEVARARALGDHALHRRRAGARDVVVRRAGAAAPVVRRGLGAAARPDQDGDEHHEAKKRITH